MRRCTEAPAALAAVLAGALALALAPASARTLVLTGEVRALDAQQIITPFANTSPVVIRYFIPEGEAVKAGDPVLRIDPGQSASQVPELENQIEQARARVAKEVAELEVKVVDARMALVDAEAELAAAKLDASIPAGLVSGLDYDRHQGELDRTRREVALKRDELATAREAVRRRVEDGALEVRKLEVQRDYHALLVASAEVRADRDGIVVHGFTSFGAGGRVDEGSTVMPGSIAGEVVGGGAVGVRAWALESDRGGLQVGQAVRVDFDALPGRGVDGTITAVAGAPERRQEWGEGRWFSVDVDFDAAGLQLLPGMSVRVVAAPAAAATAGAAP